MSLLQPLTAEKGLDFHYDIGGGLADYYRADGPRIRQVFVNMIGNAIKFTQEGSIAVRAQYAGPAGNVADWVRLEVVDTGIGVPTNRQVQIFEEFQQADSSLARRYGGSGLGLAICNRLVHAMNGKIGVESVEGEGSVFWFTLPLERMEGPAPGQAPEDQEPGSSASQLRNAG